MSTYRKLSEKTLKKYHDLEQRGELTERQAKMLANHRAFDTVLTMARARALVDRGVDAQTALIQAEREIKRKDES